MHDIDTENSIADLFRKVPLIYGSLIGCTCRLCGFKFVGAADSVTALEQIHLAQCGTRKPVEESNSLERRVATK
jgi:hypothetical protein